MSETISPRPLRREGSIDVTIPTSSLRRDRRIAVRRVRARERRRATWVTSLVLGLATLAGVGAAGGTHAFLTSSATMPGVTVHAGTLSLSINGGESAALGDWTVAPAVSQAKQFTVTNIGDVAAAIDVRSELSPAGGLGAYANARLTAVGSGQSCTPGMSGQLKDLSGYTATAVATLGPQQSQNFCLEITVDAGAPGSVAGQSLSFSLILTGVQNAQ